MKVLAIESSTDWISVAAGDGQRWHRRDEAASNAHSQRVMPLLREVLAESKWTLRAFDALAFGAGPGAFTGVRIACSIVQGLGLGAGLPVVPVGTLEALAEETWRIHGAGRVVAVLDARMREVYCAAYERNGDCWHCLQEPRVGKPDEVSLPAGEWVGAGDGFARFPILATRLHLRAIHPDVRPTARAVATLAMPRVVAGDAVPARDAHPLYVRHRVALTSVERDAGMRL